MHFIKTCKNILTLFFLWNALFCCAQTITHSPIQFEGLKKTKSSYLLQQIELRLQNKDDSNLAEEKLQILRNISSIADASYRLKNDTLVFDIKEKMTLLPILNFGGIKGNIWFQTGASDINFLGLGHQLLSYYQLNDKRHTFQIYYKIPYLKRNSKWGISANILKWSSVEPLYFPQRAVNYNYDNYSFGVSASHNIGSKLTVELGPNIFQENYEKLTEGNVELPGPPQVSLLKYLNKVELTYNNLDYHFFYLNKYITKLTWQYVFTFDDNDHFNSLIFEHKQYFRLHPIINLACRFRFGISTNNDSPFAPFVVDSHVNIRGVGNRIDRGTGQLVLNLEYRVTFFDKKKLAGQWVIFTDNGSWRSPGETISDFFDKYSFRQFVGAGCRIILKDVYNAILRIDYGIDLQNPNEKGIVIGIGQYY